MRRLADLSFSQRLTLVMTLTSSLTLVMAGAGLLVFEATRSYGQARGDLTSLAKMVGAHSGAALAFGDRGAAQETLDALRSRPDIVCAGLYDAVARPFAGYCRVGSARFLPGEPGSDRLALDGRSLVLVRPVTLDGKRAGTVLVRASLDPMADRLRGYALTVLLMTLAAMGAAVLISARLQRIVSRPILRLADTARTVTRDGNYSLRVPRLGEDDLGILTAGLQRHARPHRGAGCGAAGGS